jgi:hypothetical protein
MYVTFISNKEVMYGRAEVVFPVWGERKRANYSITISKGQLKAALGHTSSHLLHHRVHDIHPCFGTTVITLSTNTRMLH